MHADNEITKLKQDSPSLRYLDAQLYCENLVSGRRSGEGRTFSNKSPGFTTNANPASGAPSAVNAQFGSL